MIALLSSLDERSLVHVHSSVAAGRDGRVQLVWRVAARIRSGFREHEDGPIVPNTIGPSGCESAYRKRRLWTIGIASAVNVSKLVRLTESSIRIAARLPPPSSRMISRHQCDSDNRSDQR